MKHLTEIIRNLNKEEIRNYKIFANRIKHKKKKKRKIVQLFDYIKQGEYEENDPELVKALFGEDNRNAYYRLKNRLLEDIQRSLLYLHFNVDEQVRIHNYMALAKLFSYKSLYRQAIYLLRKAERKAKKQEYYELLNLIYDQVIAICRNYDEIDPEPYIKKREENAKKYELVYQTNHLIAQLNYKLKQTNFSETDKNVLEQLDKIQDDLDITNELYQIPRIQLQIHECVRNKLLQQNELESLEIYLTNTLARFEEENFFSKSTHEDKIIILSWIIITLFRNNKFDKTPDYLEKLHKALQAYNNLYYDKYIWTYYQSLAFYHNLTNQNKKAIELLEELKKETKYAGTNFYDIGLHINLALFYYCDNNLNKAIYNLSHLFTKDVYDKLSDPWKLSVSIVEIILHYEDNNIDYVVYNIKEIKRKFRSLLKTDAHKKDKAFLKILNKIIKYTAPYNNEKVTQPLHHFIEQYPSFSPGSNETINYSAWLKAKLNNEHYYNIILKKVQ